MNDTFDFHKAVVCNDPVRTRKGDPARIICTDMKCDTPVVALIKVKDEEGNEREQFHLYHKNGTSPTDDRSLDLVMDVGKHEGWVIVSTRSSNNNFVVLSHIYKTEKEAQKANDEEFHGWVTKIEWEAPYYED